MENSQAGEGGQALVEALIAIPVLIVLIQGTAWIGEMGRTKIVLTIASREGARCESLGIPGEPVTRSICQDNLPISPQDLVVKVERGLTTVKVRTEFKFASPFPALSTGYSIVSAETRMPITLTNR